MFFVLIINLGFWSLNSSSCGPAFEDGMGGKNTKMGNLVFPPRTSCFGMNPTFLSCLEAQGIYIYTNIYVQNGFPSVSDDHGGVRQTFLERYLEDSSVAVSAAACQALGRLGSAGAADAPRIAEKLADPSKRFAAVTALGYLGTETVKRNMSQIAPETAETGVLGGRHAWGAEWVDGFGSVRHN